MEEFIEDIGDFRVKVVSKPEENRAFFEIQGKLVYPSGDKRKNPELTRLSRDDEQNASVVARQWYESAFNVMFVRYGKDPMAGGLRPSKPVTEQMVHTGKRFARIKTAHSQEFPENQTILNAGGSVPITGNILPEAALMRNTPMWAGEW